MTKLDELMELNRSVDTIIASAMKDNKRTEAEIVTTEIELWNKMWDDIEEWYNKGYVEAALANFPYNSINIPYGYSDIYSISWQRKYEIKLYNNRVYLDVIGGHTEIKRDDYSLINHEYHGKCITVLLLSWKKIKDKIEQELVNSIAENIKRKTRATEGTINYNNSLLKALKGEN
jgi:hypothetical protein